jgi:hypothetical protein
MLRSEIAIAVGGDEVSDLNAPVAEDAEVHILPAIAGGAWQQAAGRRLLHFPLSC